MSTPESVALSEGIWIEEWLCGCVCAAAVADVSGEGGWLIATPDDARAHFAPPRPSGLTYRLIDSAAYRALNGDGRWNCGKHTRDELIRAARKINTEEPIL